MGKENHHQLDQGQLDLLEGTAIPIIPNHEKNEAESIEVKAMNLKMDSGEIKVPECLLIVDTETTGLDVTQDKCLEIGVILFHVSSRSVLSQHSFLLPVNSNGAQAINRIPAEITRLPQPWKKGLNYLTALIDAADLLVAHNAQFDMQWVGKDPLPVISKRWLCTMEDISWPLTRQLRSRPSVRDLALAYGIPVWNAHRALTDCIYLSDVFIRCDDLEALLIQGLEPRCLMRAQVSYENRHLAREAGFRWNDPVKGAWTRRLSERQASILDFSVVPIDKDDI